MSMVEDFIAIVHGDGTRTNFTSHLFRLIHKSDWENLAKLEKGFPDEVELFHWWRGCKGFPQDEEIRKFALKYDLTQEPEQLPLIPGPEAS